MDRAWPVKTLPKKDAVYYSEYIFQEKVLNSYHSKKIVHHTYCVAYKYNKELFEINKNISAIRCENLVYCHFKTKKG